MKVTFPAMCGTIAERKYYATMMALSEIPHLFTFNNWEEFTPELRAQRVLVRSRVPEIVKYIVDNEDSYLFSSITAAYSAEVKFKPAEEGADIGYLEMDLEDAKFLINDGQQPMRGDHGGARPKPSPRQRTHQCPPLSLREPGALAADVYRSEPVRSKNIEVSQHPLRSPGTRSPDSPWRSRSRCQFLRE